MTRTVLDRLPAPSSGAVELATLLSVAVRIEPELLRRTRIGLLPRVDVGAEADLWFSSWVAIEEPDAIILRPEVVTDLRGRLAERLTRDGTGTDPARRVWDVVSRAHAGLPAALLLEERVAWLAVQPGPVDLDAALLPALRAALGETTGTDVVSWFVRAWPRLPESARRTPTAWKIAQLARARLPYVPGLDPDVADGLLLDDVADIVGSVADVDLPVRHGGTRVVLGDSPESARTVAVPDTDPRVVDLTWTADESVETRTLYVPAGGTVSLPVHPGEAWLRTARGVLYALTPDAAEQTTGPAVHLAYAFDTLAHHRAVYQLWRLLRAAGLDATIGEPPSGAEPAWADRQVDTAAYVLVAARHGDAGRDADDGVSRLLRRDRDRRDRVVAVLLPGDADAQLPGYVEGFGLRRIRVPELSAAGVQELVDLLRVDPAQQGREASPLRRPRPDAPGRVGQGRVATFYSYKDGVGRTMALANVAWILAANGRRVLLSDWDVDAPGVIEYFRPLLPADASRAPGVVNLIRELDFAGRESSELPSIDLSRYTMTVDHRFPGGGRIDVIPAGTTNRDYVAPFDWDAFYNRANGGVLLDEIRRRMAEEYDWALVDSPSGLREEADVCAIHLPDVLVIGVGPRRQNIEGAAEIARRIQTQYGNRGIRLLPVPMDLEPAEQAMTERAMDLMRRQFAGLPADLDEAERDRYWSEVGVPRMPYYTMEERLATIEDRPGLTGSLLSSYEAITRYLTGGEVSTLPPVPEAERRRLRARYDEIMRPTVSAVVLRYAPEAALWGEWVQAVLTAIGVPVHDPADTGEPVPADARTLVILGRQERLESADATAEPSTLVFDPLDLDETSALHRLLGLVGRDTAAPDRLALPRFPGTLPPVFALPGRGTAFTGREEELRELRQRLRGSGRTDPGALVAVLGMGGIGKTQLALEYAHRYASAYDVVWWVSADPVDVVDTSIADLGEHLGVPTGSDTFRRVLTALRGGEPYRRWLLILDGADDITDLAPLVPAGPGNVIVTSRNPDWERHGSLLWLDVFTRADSIRYVTERTTHISPDEADQIAEAAGDLPLAITAATAWLRETGAPVAEYLSQVSNDAPRSVLALSLARLQGTSPGAHRLLQICSILAPEVSLELVYSDSMAEHLRSYFPEVAERIVRAKLVQDLARLALAQVDVQGTGLRTGHVVVHRLVQGAVRELMAPNELDDTRHAAHLILAAQRSPGGVDDPATWRRYEALWPHVQVTDAPSCLDDEVRALVVDMVRYRWLRGDLDRALEYARRVYRTWVNTPSGYGNEDTARRRLLYLRFHEATILRDLGDYAQARAIDEETLAEQRQLLGPGHPHTLGTADGLAADLRCAGRYAEARELSKATHAGWLDAFGSDYSRTITALNNLGVSIRLLGDFDLARQHDDAVLRARRRVLGEDNPATVAAIANLARDLRDAGEYEQSVSVFRDAVDTYERVLGADAVPSLNARADLAVSLRVAGRAAEGAPLLDHAYAKLVDLLGPDHPHTLACRLNRAGTLLAVADAAEAVAELTGVAQVYERWLGTHHPYTLACRNNLAAAIRVTRSPAAARELAVVVARDLDDVLGPRHPHTLAASNNLAVYAAEVGSATALDLMEPVARKAAEILGPEHPQTLWYQLNLARLRGSTIVDLLQRLAQRVGPDHPTVRAVWDERPLHCLIDPHPF